MFPPILTELTSDECWSLLRTVKLGRVGLSIQALPVVLPVNFAVVDGDIVFRTVKGTKFHAAAAGAVLAFEADQYEPSGSSGWSVLAQGTSSVVTDATEIARLSDHVIEPWAIDGIADRIVRLRVVTLSGRRFVRQRAN